jgi:hypothetical protein
VFLQLVFQSSVDSGPHRSQNDDRTQIQIVLDGSAADLKSVVGADHQNVGFVLQSYISIINSQLGQSLQFFKKRFEDKVFAQRDRQASWQVERQMDRPIDRRTDREPDGRTDQ